MKINNRYEILTPNGFEDFDGVQKLKKKTIEVFFDNGIKLRGSFNHQIFDFEGNPILLKNIKTNTKIKSHDGYITVIKIKKYYNKTNVFDIINSGKDHFFYSNSIISHNCDFLGSGDSVIPSETMERIAKTMIKEPKEKYMQGSLWQWKDPEEGHRYIMGVDVSRGDSDDFSSICIIDFDDREQVLEYIGKIPPDDLASIAYKWGILYNAFIVIDITGGMGVATSRKLQEMNYKDLFIDGLNTKNIWEYNSKALEKIPGINFNNKRTQIVACFEEQLRHGFIVRSNRLLNELNTFVYINGKPDHMKGAHDDGIMAIAIAMYAGDISFTQLKRNEQQNKAMLDSWVMAERTYEPDTSHYSYGSTMDQIGAMSMGMDPNNPYSNSVNKNQYQQYSWLFGKKR
jgi:sRNA-binding regulator protein Hfq